MTKYITMTKNGIIAFLLAFILVFAFAGLTHAESNGNSNDNNGDNNNEGENVKEPAQKYGITFPIVELGSCANLVECKQFCESSTNLPACINFAKKKGFYRQPRSQTEIMALAKLELGCDSADSCRAFCGEQENWLRCGEFAKRHNLGGKRDEGKQDSRKAALLQKAKTFLGCDSYDACKAFCRQPQNHSKCEELFRMVHQGENEHQGTPSGTNTTNGSAMEIKCKSYPGCSWNGERCQCGGTSGSTPSSTVKGISKGPGILQTILHLLGF